MVVSVWFLVFFSQLLTHSIERKQNTQIVTETHQIHCIFPTFKMRSASKIHKSELSLSSSLYQHVSQCQSSLYVFYFKVIKPLIPLLTRADFVQIP